MGEFLRFPAAFPIAGSAAGFVRGIFLLRLLLVWSHHPEDPVPQRWAVWGVQLGLHEAVVITG